MAKQISEAANAALNQCTVEGMNVKLPAETLDRKVYLEVKNALELIGGKWKGGKVQAFVFQEDPAELLEEIKGGERRNLKKEFQFFATPDELADRLVHLAHVEYAEGPILEPSAGQGAIIKAIHRAAPDAEVHYCELMDLNLKVLQAFTSCTFIGKDFTQTKISPLSYSAVIANPPFNKDQDIEHLRIMYDIVKPGGFLVCMTAPGWQYGSVKKRKNFRTWLDDAGEHNGESWHQFCNIGKDMQFFRKNGDRVYIEQVEPGAFKDSGTMVKTSIVVIEKA